MSGRNQVFPAGVGLSSSRDAADWLPSRFSLPVETRRRYGWLRMVFSGARLLRAPIWCPSGGWRHARGREHCRGERGSALSGRYAPDLFRAPIWCPSGGWRHARGREHCRREGGSALSGTHLIRRRRRAARSSTSQGRAELLCARITGLNREVSERKADF